MQINHEIKSQLAKLLATEDLIVENKKVETAQFDVHNRILTLPQWEKASNNVYDALVSHEVGHALYTPDREWFKEVQIPQQYVNVCEDIRIENLMKRRYAGLTKTFFTGYHELSDDDFFNLADEDVDEMGLADRINIDAKIGHWNDVYFTDKEKEIRSLIHNTETFDDVLKVSQILFDYCKAEMEELQKLNEELAKVNMEMEGSGNNNMEDTEASDSPEEDVEDDKTDSSKESPDQPTQGQTTSTAPQGGAENDPTPQVKTVESLENSLKELNSLESSETEYFEIPKIKLENLIIPNDVLDKLIVEDFAEQQKKWEEENVFDPNSMFCKPRNLFDSPDVDFVKFKKSAQKEVNYLVKEFECKKSASAYARAATSRTGVLNTAKLHTYKFNEDLFKKVTVLPDGKNHGLVFILDWSGSMSPYMMDTIKQLYNLIWFCNKVKIPFEVYAFTNCFPRTLIARDVAADRKPNQAYIEESFSLMNILTSRVRGKHLERQMRNIFRTAMAFDNRRWCVYRHPIGMSLSGTPLNETICALHEILPKFQKENKLEKVQCVILTDGEGHPLRYNKEFNRPWEEEPYLGTNNIGSNSILRNRRTGRTYDCSRAHGYCGLTDILLEDLRHTFPSINLIGIRLLDGRDAGYFVRQHIGYDNVKVEEVMKRWKKEKAFGLSLDGYHKYFGLSATSLNSDSDFEPKSDSKADIKKAFTKSLRAKKMNKKILGEFIELVA